jgi:hypothetical protein
MEATAIRANSKPINMSYQGPPISPADFISGRLSHLHIPKYLHVPPFIMTTIGMTQLRTLATAFIVWPICHDRTQTSLRPKPTNQINTCPGSNFYQARHPQKHFTMTSHTSSFINIPRNCMDHEPTNSANQSYTTTSSDYWNASLLFTCL